MSDPDRAMIVFVGIFMLLGVVAAIVIMTSQQREAQAWKQFSAEHCRLSGSYDKEGRRASPRQEEYELKIYHCDDGTVHVR